LTIDTQELTERELKRDALSGRTIFLARLLGLFLIVIGLSMLVETRANYEYAVTTILGDPPLALLVSVITVAEGLAMVLAHNIWRGGALPMGGSVQAAALEFRLKSFILYLSPLEISLWRYV
jgi:hypothetical protein